MNKELTPLEALEKLKLNNYFFSFDKELCDIIETALKENQDRIEELEETNHLMFLKEHKNNKNLKAFDIIKEKKPNLIVIFGTYQIKTYEEYFNFVKENDKEIGEDKYDLGKLLTKEEFDLLKEILL